MSLLTHLYRESRRLLLIATTMGIVSGISGAAVIAVIGKALGNAGQSMTLALSFLAACLLYLVSKSCSEISLVRLTQNAVLRLRVDLARKVLAAPVKRLQRLGKHGLLAILTKDVDTFILAFEAVPLVFGNVIVIVVCLAYMAWLSWQLFLMFVTLFSVCLFIYRLAERKPVAQMAKLRDHMDILYAHFRDLVEGSKELKLNAKRGTIFVEDILAPSARYSRNLYVGAITRYSWVANIGTVFFYLIIGTLIFAGARWAPHSPEMLTTSVLVILYLIHPISEIVFHLPAIRQAGIALNKIQELGTELATAPTQMSIAIDPFSSGESLRLELKGVRHHYESAESDRQFTLGPLNLTIHQGKILFIVGGNGSGKTTLAMLLLGMYEPEEGSIILNGKAVTSHNLECYRQYFSAVFADFHLFERLMVSNDPSTDQCAFDYVKELGLGHKVSLKDGKFSTINLSTGQRKRLALVSAYVEDRPIYLFDEWAADQDPEFKMIFYTKLLPDLKSRGKTVIVISHDDAYFRFADSIVKLQDGRLTEHLGSVLMQML